MDEKLVVVLDTNVFISGLLSSIGAPGLILRRFRQQDFEIVTSQEQIREVQMVLKRPSLARALPRGTTKDAVRFFVDFRKMTLVFKPPRLKWEFKDKGDHFLLDLAAHTQADFLVTGDHDLQTLKIVFGTSIVSPLEFLGCL